MSQFLLLNLFLFGTSYFIVLYRIYKNESSFLKLNLLTLCLVCVTLDRLYQLNVDIQDNPVGILLYFIACAFLVYGVTSIILIILFIFII